MSRPLFKLKMGLLISIRPLILRLNKSNYKNVVWVIGSGRSGTTWVSDLINYKKRYRELIEPFRPKRINEASFLKLHQYLRVENDWSEFDAFSEKVFTGNFYHKDVDSANNQLLYKDLLVKDVFANLFAYHVSKKFPDIKVVLLIRNPIDVALSKLAKRDWIWMDDPTGFFEQEHLMSDFLEPYRELIKEIGNSDDLFIKHILVWCIINYVPLKQFKKEELYILFYESVLETPNAEISKLNGFTQNEKTIEVSIPKKIIEQPSRVTDKKKVKKATLVPSENQITKATEILQAFGLHNVYSNGKPNREGLLEFGF